MIVRKYGLIFRRLQHSDIEIIRKMRNSDDIRRRMHAQQHITAEQQERWFRDNNTINNYFFVICAAEKPVGLVQAKNVNYQARTGEGGIYIWDSNARSSGIGAKASLCLLDIAFMMIGLKTITAKVRTDNPIAQRHNLSFGYCFSEEGSSEFMTLSRESFFSRAPKLRKLCSRGNDLRPTSIDDMDFPESSILLELYAGLPDDIRSIFSEKIKGLN
ncbi:MAG: GNAT family N-acetyltransferase [Gammaproteobacteria bacterium]|jgi:RimJ/RimL family protein N-acetyltransferase|nr:GNAT family N-acetyltransferase [Gammaproteobacteria bacterium]MBQ0774701.1 GNAT family N-acetyltransferase [Gammaproteobacteria bacterium]